MTLGVESASNKVSTKNLRGGKGWTTRKAENPTANYEPIV
jgi:hypothetical protein